MADDAIDTSDMPDPTTIGLKPPAAQGPAGIDTSDMPTPAQLFKQHKGYDAPAQGEIDEFMRNPDATPPVKGQKTALQGLSMLSGLPSIAAQANPITPVLAGAVGGLNALPASVGAILEGTIGGNPDEAARLGEVARKNLMSGAGVVYNLANYLPSKIITKEGQEYADRVLSLPQQVAKSAEPTLNATIGEPATTSLGEWGTGAATLLPAAGAKGLALRGVNLAKTGAGAAARALKPDVVPEGTTYDQGGTAVAPDTNITPPVGKPVTGDQLRAAPNPIPAPEGTVHRTLTEEGKSPAAPDNGAGAMPYGHETNPVVTSPPVKPPLPPKTAGEIVGNTPSPEEMTYRSKLAGQSATPPTEPADPLVAAASQASDPFRFANGTMGADERGSARIFNSPKEEGPQETPKPEEQDQRAAALKDLDDLSGGGLPSRRASAVSGDYNDTGRDWQLKETDSAPMVAQVASENNALHTAAKNVHDSVGSLSDDSVDQQTMSDRGRTVRGALQAIQGWFQKATDESYDAARAVHGNQPMPQFLNRVKGFLSDDANYMPEGFRKSAQARLKQLETVGDNGVAGDGSDAVGPKSVGAAEKFREWLNQNRTLDNAHTVKQLVDHTDTDVTEQGGPGLFQTARAMRRHQYQMTEEPKLMGKLLSANDSQGINHSVEDHKVMDTIAEAGAGQHEHLMNVLRAGAHLGKGELAESSAAAIREIQGHLLSRLHDAATDDGGKWNARSFYNATQRYGRNAASTFADRPDVLRNLKTLNDAGNVLHMDKHYPGAVGQEVKSGLGAAALKGAGNLAASAAHEIPMVGRLVGRGIEGAVEGMSEKGREAARDKLAMSRLVDRNGKQRGSVQVMPSKEDFEKNAEHVTMETPVEHTVDEHGDHNFSTGEGRSHLKAEDTEDGGLRVRGSFTHPEDQRQGYGGVLYQHAADTALARGGSLTSDSKVSESAGRRWAELGRQGYDVQRNPAARPTADRGLITPDGSPAFSISRKVPLGQRIPGQRGSFSFQNDNAINRQGTFHGKDVERNPRSEYNANRQIAGNQAETAERAEILRRLSGQRGSVRVMNAPEYQAPKELQDFIRKSAPAHRIDPNGPSNWEELQARRHEPVMPINPQGGEGSIYKDVPTNMAFRAWHDKTHLDVGGGFDHDGELATAKEQLRQAQKAGLSEESQKALWADTWETFKHHEDTGSFPENPRQFVAQRMQDKTPLGERVAASKQRGSVKVMGEAPKDEYGSTLNIGLHQGQEGKPGFKKMSKQEAQAAVESTGAKVTKNTVLTPKQHGVMEPTAVMSTDRPISDYDMQKVLAKTKQSAIPQRTGQGDESMHVAPGHEQTAKDEGWDKFNRDYFREHDGRTATEAEANPSAPNPYPPHPDATVKGARQSAFPGIYDDPKQIMERLGPGAPESPHLKEIFGKSRKDLHDDALARGDVEPKTPIPGITQKGAGSAAAANIKTPENAERLRSIIQAYKEHDPSGYHGMVGWYEMDPMYHSIKKILGGNEEAASRVYHNLNSMTAYASPMSPVGTEIKRGTAAAMMAAEGNFDKFATHGNLPQKRAPAELKAKNFELGNEGTMAHGSQAPAMGRFLETGQEANAVKTGTYRRSSDAPSRPGSDYQNTQPVGDSHWSRGAGLADVRGAKAFEGSATGTEMKTLGKWFHDQVARHPDVDLPSTSAQAVQWGALSKETGVDTPIGAPKLEIWADKIAEAAKREGIAPKAMWERIVKRLAK